LGRFTRKSQAGDLEMTQYETDAILQRFQTLADTISTLCDILMVSGVILSSLMLILVIVAEIRK